MRLLSQILIICFLLLTPSCGGAKASEPSKIVRIEKRLDSHENRLESNTELLDAIYKDVKSISKRLKEHMEETK